MSEPRQVAKRGEWSVQSWIFQGVKMYHPSAVPKGRERIAHHMRGEYADCQHEIR